MNDTIRSVRAGRMETLAEWVKRIHRPIDETGAFVDMEGGDDLVEPYLCSECENDWPCATFRAAEITDSPEPALERSEGTARLQEEVKLLREIGPYAEHGIFLSRRGLDAETLCSLCNVTIVYDGMNFPHEPDCPWARLQKLRETVAGSQT